MFWFIGVIHAIIWKSIIFSHLNTSFACWQDAILCFCKGFKSFGHTPNQTTGLSKSLLSTLTHGDSPGCQAVAFPSSASWGLDLGPFVYNGDTLALELWLPLQIHYLFSFTQDHQSRDLKSSSYFLQGMQGVFSDVLKAVIIGLFTLLTARFCSTCASMPSFINFPKLR